MEYYVQLPSSVSPKTEFICEIMKRCTVSFATARNWVLYGVKPIKEEHKQVLSELTGIAVENLWRNE